MIANISSILPFFMLGSTVVANVAFNVVLAVVVTNVVVV